MGALFSIAFLILVAAASPLAAESRDFTRGNKILG